MHRATRSVYDVSTKSLSMRQAPSLAFWNVDPAAAAAPSATEDPASASTPRKRGLARRARVTWRILFGGKSDQFQEWTDAEGATTLVVLFHAYGTTPGSLNQVARKVKKTFPDADLFRPQLPIHVFSFANFNVVAKDIVATITERFAAKNYARIILVGHSFGALLARKVYIVACGRTESAPFEREFDGMTAAPWAPQVDRLILLAAMNRGWRITHHLSLTKAVGLSFGVFVGRIVELFTRRPLLVMQLRKGAPALTQLRLQWLAMRDAREARGSGGAMTVQLLGSIDDLVSPEDNVDLVSGKDFIYLDVPRSGHLSLIYLEGDPKLKDSEEEARAVGRTAVFVGALSSSHEELKKNSVDMVDSTLAEDPSVTHVIFVVHGIRDEGYWTQKIARHIKALAEANDRGRVKFAMVTSSYGYFPMAPFLIAGQRRKKVEWLMDQYVQAVSRYPNARENFFCVAHSNGTYLVAKALQDYPAVRFERIVFAGSVVDQKYPWNAVANQAKSILNFIATSDWVVAYFPKLFQQLELQDLGSAGHDGFATDRSGLFQVRYVSGGHSAALEETHWNEIAQFILHGRTSEASGEPGPVVSFLGRYPIIVWIGIIGILVLCGWFIWAQTGHWPGIRGAALIIYVWLIWKLLNWL